MTRIRFTSKRPLRVGTDCSGMEAPIVALRQLNIPFSHEFSSEIDKYCIATIKANFTPKKIFGDMRRRRLKEIPDIDLYICGFPCQPFSVAGKRKGMMDPRGTIFWECLRVIRYKRPMVFILENVRGLLSIDKGETFRAMMYELEKLKIYNLYWNMLNTADYGIPQSRERLFIVGILMQQEDAITFQWPQHIQCKPLKTFVDWNDRSRYPLPRHFYDSGMSKIINKKAIFIDLSFTNHRHTNADRICPCITTGCHNMYNLLSKRYMNINELLALQGFPDDYIQVVSKSQFQKQIGNAMSVNVLRVIFKNIFHRN